MLELILVRHGETAWNRDRIFRGRIDVPLGEKGFRQADLLGEYLGQENIMAVYASPLQRAVQTATPLAKNCGLDIITTDGLIDMDFGEWQGIGVDDVRERCRELFDDWLCLPEQVAIPGGESLSAVLERSVQCLEDATIRPVSGKLVFVTHRVVLKLLIGYLLQLPLSSFWNIQIDPCGITRFTLEGKKAVLVTHNETAYLSTECSKGQDF